MPKKWQYRITIRDIHDHYDEHEDICHCGKMMAEKLRELEKSVRINRSKELLASLADDFENVEDVEQYDDLLKSLYDWADDGKRCWVNSFE